MAIFLIRHGETVLNAARIVQMPDTPLSPRGRAQAERLARRLAGEGIGLILSSDLPRARMTAECLRDTTGAPIALDPGLQERNFGEVRGQPYSALGVDLLAPDFEPPGGEPWAEFYARVDAVWQRIAAAAAAAAGSLAVVTHGLVCHALLERHLAVPEGSVRAIWGNASLTVVEAAPPWRVRLLNCTRHLDEELEAGSSPAV
ncbi:MAG: histidine phosphatase family protein [Candidatus Binatia bacterium]